MTQPIYRVDFVGRNVGGIATTFRYASAAYTTTPAHPDLPNQHFEGLAIQPLVFSRSLYGGNRAYGQEQNPASGAVILNNADGALDMLVDHAFDGGLVQVWRIDPAAPDTELLEFEGVCEQGEMDDTRLTLTVRDKTYLLDRALQATKYAGTNILPAGIEGTPDNIKGQPKPISLGRAFLNAEPVCANTSRLIYQVAESLVTGYSLTVYDQRVVLTRGADYASQAAMETTAPAAGQYRVWPAGGCFRLGSTPTGQITFDLSNSAAGISDSFAHVADLLVDRTGTTWATEAVRMGAGYASPGLFFRTETTIYRALRDLMRSCNGSFQAYTNRLGGPSVLSITRLESPSFGPAGEFGPEAPVLELDEMTVEAGSLRLVQQGDRERGIPPWRITVGYRRNLTVQNASALAGVAAADIAFCEREYRTVQVDAPLILSQFPAAGELRVDTDLPTEADAIAFGEYLRGLLCTKRLMFTLRIDMSLTDPLLFDFTPLGAPLHVPGLLLGQPIRLTYPRFTLDYGRLMRVVGITLDFAVRKVDLTVWG